jgi:hypothetical protein
VKSPRSDLKQPHYCNASIISIGTTTDLSRDIPVSCTAVASWTGFRIALLAALLFDEQVDVLVDVALNLIDDLVLELLNFTSQSALVLGLHVLHFRLLLGQVVAHFLEFGCGQKINTTLRVL